jgi:hypothetical protein
MHIKVFDNFSLGKLGGKNKKDSPVEITARASRIADMETKINGKTKDLKKATEKLNGLRTDAGIAIPVDVIPVRPHGPVAELTLEPEDLSDNSGIALDEVISDEPVTLGGDIKIAEVSAEKIAAVKAVPVAAAALPVEGKKEGKKDEKQDEADSLNNLFSQDEEEENPLASLINSLPDVTVRELMDDLGEIHRIIKEWRPSSKRTF